MTKLSRNPRKLFMLKNSYHYLIVLIVFNIFISKGYADSQAAAFLDDFSSGSLNWTPVSGAWIAENGQYMHKEIGVNYVTQSFQQLFNDDFILPNPSIVTSAMPFSDDFSGPDGAATQWSVKRGAFSIVNSEYVASNGSATLSVPTDTTFGNWTDYRITTKIKRNGASDASGYTILYFRVTMMDATRDNSYALVFRQTGVAELWKRVNGSWSSNLGSFVIPKDNNWHNVIVRVIGPSLTVWFDKTENFIPDISVASLTDFTQGTIGVGTQSWNSNFDDIQIESISSDYRWLYKKGIFNVQNGEYYAQNSGSINSLSILSDNSSSSWNDYEITTKIKRDGDANAYGYAIVYFRLTMVDATHDNSYALIFRQTGYAELWKRVNGAWNSSLGSFVIPADNNWHNVIIQVSGASLKVWFDKNETYAPDLSILDGLADYPIGTIGVGTTGWVSHFDDFIVDPVFSIQTAPYYLYTNSNNTTTLSISSSFALNNLQLTVTNPSNISWNLNSPPQCAGNKACQVVFPTDFPGADITGEGTYLISVSNGGDISYVLLEVREKPLFSFMDITDLHDQYNYIGDFVKDTNDFKFFPSTDFVVLTGDLTNYGTASELSQVKAELDKLTVPYYTITGNHDTVSENGNSKGLNWANTFGPDKFSYSWTNGNFLFLAMDVESFYGGYGSNLSSIEHTTWLQDILNANSDKNVLLFTHYALKEIRDDGLAKDYWQLEAQSKKVRPLLESHGKVIAEIAGHNHLHGMKAWNGIYYITTASFVESGVYRYIEVYSDRLESHILKKKYYCSTSCYDHWLGSTDSTHGTSTYTYGLPIERQFKIHYASKTVSILDGISIAGDMSWQDYTYKADIKLENKQMLGENAGGLVFRYNNKDNFYSVLLDSASDTVVVQKKQDGVVTDLASVSVAIDLYSTYNLKVNVQGNRIKVYLNDLILIDISDSTFVSGKIGFRSFRSNTAYDNVSVTLDATNADPNGQYTITGGQSAILDGSDSNVSNGKSIVLYEWDLNNDGFFEYSSPSPTISYIFPYPGMYFVRLRVTDNLGITDEALATVYFIDTVPSANFTASPRNGSGPLTVYFTNLSTGDDQPLSYAWDFDNDGMIDSTEQNPFYIYENPDTYTISLTVTDSNGSVNSLSAANYVIVDCALPVMISRASPVYFETIQDAYNAAIDGDIVRSQASDFLGDLNMNRNISLSLIGGYNCDFSAITGVSAINGIIFITNGTNNLENIVSGY
jgi:PKD repeat protein